MSVYSVPPYFHPCYDASSGELTVSTTAIHWSYMVIEMRIVDLFSLCLRSTIMKLKCDTLGLGHDNPSQIRTRLRIYLTYGPWDVFVSEKLGELNASQSSVLLSIFNGGINLSLHSNQISSTKIGAPTYFQLAYHTNFDWQRHSCYSYSGLDFRNVDMIEKSPPQIFRLEYQIYIKKATNCIFFLIFVIEID